MRAGATAFNGIGPAKLIFGYIKYRTSADNDCDGVAIRGCCLADLAVDGVDELFERSIPATNDARVLAAMASSATGRVFQHLREPRLSSAPPIR